MIDFDELYNSVIKKTQRLMESKGMALSLREIKEFNRINLAGSRNDGERLLRLELVEKYGEEILEQSLGYHILYPFIDEGVIKTTTKRNEIFYTLFYVTEKREKDFDLFIYEYVLRDTRFCLRYVFSVRGIPIRRIGESIMYDDFRCGCIKNFIFDAISEKELSQYYDPMEYRIIKEFAENEEKYCENQAKVILNQVISTFASINFLLERNSKFEETINKDRHARIEKEFIDVRPKRKIISLEENVKVEVNQSDEDITEEKERIIKRHTSVWTVSGHLRHYKSGKIIFIKSYPKGPNRDKIESKKKEYDLPQEEDDIR